MNLRNHIKLWGGIAAVLILMTALTLLFNQRQQQVPSDHAIVDAPVSNVASSYGGVVTQVFVAEGDEVTVGEPMFVVTSASLQQAFAQGAQPASNVAFDLDPARGLVTYKAVADGYVTNVKGVLGSFVNDGESLAAIVSDQERSVLASYTLSPLDYGRVELGARAEILMPNNDRLSGEVAGVQITSSNGETVSEVRVVSDELNAAELGTLGQRGTPVSVSMSLRDDGFLAGPTDAVLTFLTKIGLR
ncbi:MAG: biotin/lipoyl-binding protein [Acidobacteriota bacterium]|nr:biotin/lipoyl-binding protein [Acidobacteriota bacterium]NLH70011.1 biotin/lipoyl-binding protein [Brooklawnia sp.]